MNHRIVWTTQFKKDYKMNFHLNSGTIILPVDGAGTVSAMFNPIGF